MEKHTKQDILKKKSKKEEEPHFRSSLQTKPPSPLPFLPFFFSVNLVATPFPSPPIFNRLINYLTNSYFIFSFTHNEKRNKKKTHTDTHKGGKSGRATIHSFFILFEIFIFLYIPSLNHIFFSYKYIYK
ncbi:hypothetical protein, unlikely [Trypanosoma brucei gambiense DAL972]|uniref:Uncharacterized protein n=1 Tax=Trypanosoma brucei gambiense (strain MHOM/CI/86/DAL972) TaxID=679716 RepID=C9ZKN6_TRYB9|nr:hypothetical protein, unlikely [Trypanosoma brucei gambiense DAL972]CBH10252.1 hypothetical protein, unlikely [Trypanosoma brucei gambiense DAL972]|eukprot:XP_011772542.1 hypothetical protein, unlikely [Trypanosoma brucei gambiense DAL972]